MSAAPKWTCPEDDGPPLAGPLGTFCPFCGSARGARMAALPFDGPDDTTLYRAECRNDACRARGPMARTEADAAAAWGRRGK